MFSVRWYSNRYGQGSNSSMQSNLISISTTDISLTFSIYIEFVHWLKERTLRKSVCLLCLFFLLWAGLGFDFLLHRFMSLIYKEEENGETYSITFCKCDGYCSWSRLSSILSSKTFCSQQCFPHQFVIGPGISLISHITCCPYLEMMVKSVHKGDGYTFNS